MSNKTNVISNIVSILINYNQLFMVQITCVGLLYIIYKINFRQKEAYFWLNLEKEIQEQKAHTSYESTA
ncbi:MAG: hypothetical protein HC944_06010 [Nanoarchaeota archaeon]|nr:hypothetical protein [Nanoarchaeota archaeon]